MKKITLMMLAAILSIAALAQDNGVSKILNGPAFEELYVMGPVVYELIEAETPAVHIEGAFEVVREAEVTWTKKTLSIYFPNHLAGQKLSVKIYVKNLKALHAEDNAKVISPRPLNSEKLMITVNDISSAKIVNRGRTHVYNLSNVTVSYHPYKYEPKAF